jgi:hypothetical protein
MSKLLSPEFDNEDAAFMHFESIVWPNGPRCPHCGGVERLIRLKSKSVRAGLWECCKCRKQFTAKIGTFLEHSRLPMTKWLQVVYLMASSKTDIPAYRLCRIVEMQYNTAWFIARHLREAMRRLNRGKAKAQAELSKKSEKGVKIRETQVAKFRAAVRELGHEESEDSYDALLRKLAQQKPMRRRVL